MLLVSIAVVVFDGVRDAVMEAELEMVFDGVLEIVFVTVVVNLFEGELDGELEAVLDGVLEFVWVVVAILEGDGDATTKYDKYFIGEVKPVPTITLVPVSSIART